MIATNQTAQDYWFGPLHLPGGVNQSLYVDDTSDTSLYLTDDGVADAINTLAAAAKITVSSEAQPFPRPTGSPEVLHGNGSPEGLTYAGQGSLYLNRSAGSGGYGVYTKTTGIHLNTGWVALSQGSGAAVATTVAGLGTGVDGSIGLVRVGSSPFDFVALLYDATYGKWVSAPWFCHSGSVSVSGTTWSDVLPQRVIFQWGAFNTAGLKLQGKMEVDGVDTSNNQNGCYARFYTGNNTTTQEANNAAVAPTSFGSMNYLAHQGGVLNWTDLAISANTYGSVRFQNSTQDSNGHAGTFVSTCYLRWTS